MSEFTAGVQCFQHKAKKEEPTCRSQQSLQFQLQTGFDHQKSPRSNTTPTKTRRSSSKKISPTETQPLDSLETVRTSTQQLLIFISFNRLLSANISNKPVSVPTLKVKGHKPEHKVSTERITENGEIQSFPITSWKVWTERQKLKSATLSLVKVWQLSAPESLFVLYFVFSVRQKVLTWFNSQLSSSTKNHLLSSSFHTTGNTSAKTLEHQKLTKNIQSPACHSVVTSLSFDIYEFQ